MIIPMKKATIMFGTQDAEAAIAILRGLGLIHVEHQNLPEGRDITVLSDKVALIDAAVDALDPVLAMQKSLPGQEKMSGDWTAIARRIIESGRRREELEAQRRTIAGKIQQWERWGDIDIRTTRQLGEKGIILRLYLVPAKETGNFPPDAVVRKIFTAGDITHCAVFSKRPFSCPYTEIVPPDQGISALKEEIAAVEANDERLKREIIQSGRFRDDFRDIRVQLTKELAFQQVLHGMGREGAIGYVTGFIPSDREDALLAQARQSRWGILITEPSDDDDVPTLLRNPPWVDMIKPVLGLLGLTPGYRELDVSTLFLVFFSIFFGILIGDAGYGLVYIVLTLAIMLWLKKKSKFDAEMRTMVSLFYLLGSCAVIWGVLTGTFFGQGFLPPAVPVLNNPGFMETFCFFLGALHLSIAHAWRAVMKFPSPAALSDVGWICVLWFAFFLAKTLILGEAFPMAGLWLVIAGVVLVVLFTSPQKNRVLRGIGEGLGTAALSFMNNITDVISYIRLFAVGLATLAIAETTNFLASGFFGQGVFALIAGILVLCIGHALNVVLGPMSVLVHGVRLNVLEFSGHANVTWSGKPFEPFKE